MKIFTAKQVKSIDQYTIENEPVSSADLMERAALACFRKIITMVHPDDQILAVCGKGNNGGDGLAIARLLRERDYDASVLIVENEKEFSPDALQNYEKFRSMFPEHIRQVTSVSEAEEFLKPGNTVIIDAIFGTGLNKPVEGLAAEVIRRINHYYKKIISIDIPSGLPADEAAEKNSDIVRSSVTLSLEFPKLSFMMPENKYAVPEFEIVDIRLHPDTIRQHSSPNYFIEKREIRSLLQKRNKFDHKGTFGHALLLAGSKGKAGAAVIAAKACLRSGAGLLTVHSTADVLSGLLHHLPEAMSSYDNDAEKISSLEQPQNFDAVGFGPGTGTHEDTQTVLKKLLQYYTGKVVIDADGLNILSENKTWLDFLTPETILTPHPKEFERLAGKAENDFERIEMLRRFSTRYNVIVILKGAHSAIAMPDGNIFFNSTGNPGLAKGGSGDGLTGILLGLLARGYSPPKAALIGTFVHGFAADLSLKKISQESLLFSDVIQYLPKAFKKLEK